MFFISKDTTLAPGFVSLGTHSLSDHMQSLSFKFHLYTNSFQTHVAIWASLLNCRQLEVHLIGTLNIMCPRLLVIPLCWTCSFCSLLSISYPRNNQWYMSLVYVFPSSCGWVCLFLTTTLNVILCTLFSSLLPHYPQHFLFCIPLSSPWKPSI